MPCYIDTDGTRYVKDRPDSAIIPQEPPESDDQQEITIAKPQDMISEIKRRKAESHKYSDRATTEFDVDIMFLLDYSIVRM